MFNENTELIPPSESSDIYTGNYNPTEGIALALVGIYFSNQRFWAEVSNLDQTRDTNTLYLFF